MEERVRHLGGEFRLDSQSHNGTRISVLLPLGAPATAPAPAKV
jgi:signal transduction histidine kinase